MLEKMLIEHCSPALAGLKTANMFNYRFSSADMLLEELQETGRKLNEKGVYIEVLRIRDGRALLYVYRKRSLEKNLQDPEIRQFLGRYGYPENDPQRCLERMKQRFQESECFPHEIGIFLDYPLEDVTGFIEHGGKNCKLCGVWKVYGNECKTQELFNRFRKCTEIYRKVFAGGRTLTQLTVAA